MPEAEAARTARLDALEARLRACQDIVENVSLCLDDLQTTLDTLRQQPAQSPGALATALRMWDGLLHALVTNAQTFAASTYPPEVPDA